MRPGLAPLQIVQQVFIEEAAGVAQVRKASINEFNLVVRNRLGESLLRNEVIHILE